MKFITATHSILLNVETNNSFEIKKTKTLNYGHHYGLSVDDCKDCFISKNDDNYLNIFDKNSLEIIKTHQFELDIKFVHQVLFYNEFYFISNTFHNSIVCQNKDRSITYTYKINKETEDINHVNSLFLSGEIVYALLHNRAVKNAELLILKFSKEKGFSKIKKIKLNDRACHNIFIDDKYLCYNASKKGDFVVLDRKNLNEVKRLSFSGHTKGLSVTKNYFIIGCSDHAKRDDRIKTKGNLIFINRNSFEVVKNLPIKDENGDFTIGNINEIRCISEKDFSESNENLKLVKPRRRILGIF